MLTTQIGFNPVIALMNCSENLEVQKMEMLNNSDLPFSVAVVPESYIHVHLFDLQHSIQTFLKR